MHTYTKEEVEINYEQIREKIISGEVFIYPTDTIYGIGCNATNREAVKKIRELKQRPDQPFSIIAPSVDWIKQNCERFPNAGEWLEKLPGPYTLIFNLKKANIVAQEINPLNKNKTLGVRIPDHWISDMIEEMGIPIVTTSANLVGKSFMTSMEDLDPDIKKGVKLIIYEGEKKGKPSKIIHLETENAKIKER